MDSGHPAREGICGERARFSGALGNLNNGGNAGAWVCNGNNGLSNANWNIGARLSGNLQATNFAATTARWGAETARPAQRVKSPRPPGQ